MWIIFMGIDSKDHENISGPTIEPEGQISN